MSLERPFSIWRADALNMESERSPYRERPLCTRESRTFSQRVAEFLPESYRLSPGKPPGIFRIVNVYHLFCTQLPVFKELYQTGTCHLSGF